MKRIDYFWPKVAVKFTGIIFGGQFIGGFVAARKPDYEGVFQASCLLFMSAMVWLLSAILINAIDTAMKEDSK
jgi:hypothetical protein